MVPVQLASLVVDEQAEAQQLRLNETGGTRGFTILIGLFEALAIQRGLSEARAERPLTHKLVLDLLKRLGASLERVLIDNVQSGSRGETFFAKLVLDRDGEELRVDCRPSDAIAIAVRARAPIYVTEKVMDAVS